MANIYLQVQGVDGTSKQKGYEKYMDIESFSHGFVHPIMIERGEASVGEVQASEFNFVKHSDAASVKLMKACCSGKDLEKAILVLLKSAGENKWIPYLKYEFKTPRVSAFSPAGSTGGLASESFSLFCEEVQVTFTDSAGNQEKGQLPFKFNFLTREVG